MNKYYNNKLAIFIFAFPALVLFTTFVVYPILPEILISLYKHNGFDFQGFVGISNYKEILTSNEFWHYNFNTLKMVLVSTLIGVPFSLLLALMLDNQSERMRKFFKVSSFIPAVLSVTVLAQMWIAIYEPQWGAINSLLRLVGISEAAKSWLSEENTVLGSITFAFLWQYIGFNMVIFYAGIKTIPKTYYEAALIDGANFFESSVKITIPLLQEVIKFMMFISVLGCMGQFTYVRIMTDGGPGDISRTIIYQLYYTSFKVAEFGKGSAIAVIFVIECLFITFIINRFIARERIQY